MLTENDLKSIFAPEMRGYLDLLKASNRPTEDYLYTFHSLDKYLVKNGVVKRELSEKLLSDWLSSRHIAGKTRNYEIARMRVFARYLMAFKVYAFELELCREEKTYKAYTFDDEEISRIFEIADSGVVSYVDVDSGKIFPVVLRILYATGMRINEVLGLKWANVDLVNGIFVITQAKNNLQRRVPFHDSLLNILQQYEQRRTQGHPTDEYLFTNRDDDMRIPYKYETFGYWFKKVLAAAGIDNPHGKPFERGICTHVLRHNFTFRSFQQAMADGRSFEETAPYLAAYLGHDSFASTEEYLTTDYTMYTESQERTSAAIQSVFPEVTFE